MYLPFICQTGDIFSEASLKLNNKNHFQAQTMYRRIKKRNCRYSTKFRINNHQFLIHTRRFHRVPALHVPAVSLVLYCVSFPYPLYCNQYMRLILQ